MKIKKVLLLFVSSIVFGTAFMMGPNIAHAQETPHIISSTRPINSELRDNVDAWLASSPPSNAIYYAVTYTQPNVMGDTYVSLVGVDLQSPDESWSLIEEDDSSKAIWLGTVKVLADGSVQLLTRTQAELSRSSQSTEMASLFFIPPPVPLLDGGGSYVRFPWEPAKAVKWGNNGLHGAGYLLSGYWRGIDLVSGSDMGSGAAKDSVYASDTGAIDWVCDDGTSVAITTSGSYDPFLYAHLLNNANLEIGHTFSSGSLIGTLKHGSFADTCGVAVQTGEHWHLHWGFVTNDSAAFQAEGCILTSTASAGELGGAIAVGEKWTCGNTVIKPGGYLTHYGDIAGANVEDLGAGGSPSFWDYLLLGAHEIFRTLFANNLPEHRSVSTFTTPLLTGVKIVLRIAIVLLHGNFNLAPAVTLILATIAFNLVTYSIAAAIYIARIIATFAKFL